MIRTLWGHTQQLRIYLTSDGSTLNYFTEEWKRGVWYSNLISPCEESFQIERLMKIRTRVVTWTVQKVRSAYYFSKYNISILQPICVISKHTRKVKIFSKIYFFDRISFFACIVTFVHICLSVISFLWWRMLSGGPNSTQSVQGSKSLIHVMQRRGCFAWNCVCEPNFSLAHYLSIY